MKESFIIESALNEEKKVIDSSVLTPSQQSLKKEVIHSLYEKRDEIFAQVSEKYSLDDSMVNYRNFSVEFQGQSEEASNFDTLASSLLEDEGIVHIDSQKESHEMNQQSDENLYTPLLEINEDIQHPYQTLGGKVDNYYFSKRKQKVLSPLSEYEIDQLLKSHVTTQANAGLPCSHSQEGVSETFSTFENEDSVEIIFIDQLTDISFFHEDDRIVMFDNLEECFMFKNDINY